MGEERYAHLIVPQGTAQVYIQEAKI